MFGLFKKSKYQHLVGIPKRREFVLDYRTKHPLILYRYMHKKMVECIGAFFEGYPEDKYIFYPPSEVFNDRFFDLKEKFLEIDKSEDFQSLPVTSLRSFDPFSNYKDLCHLWNLLKRDVHDEHQMLIRYTERFEANLPDDLQVLFNELDVLIREHNQEKNKVLKANHIYPTNNYLLPFRKNSVRAAIFDILSQANDEYVSVQAISQKIKERNFQYIRIVLNQLQKVIEKRKQPLKIESNGKGYYRLVNIN